MIFWILFVWLPLILYVLQFWKWSFKNGWVVFRIKDQLEMLITLFIPLSAVIALCLALDGAIEELPWNKL